MSGEQAAPRVLTISVTEPGRRVAQRLPFEHVHGEPAATLSARWTDIDAFVMVLALGATVRLVSPLLSNKESDPAVVCVDDAGSFAISVCGGHAGGANALAHEVARLLGAQPVITTATDRMAVPALDQLVGLRAEGDVARVTAALLAGDAIEIDRELEWPLPASLTDHLARAGSPAPTDGGTGEPVRIVLSDRVLLGTPEAGAIVALRPPSLVVGLGTTSDATEADACDAVTAALTGAGLSPLSLGALGTIDRRADHAAIMAVARRWHLPVHTFGADRLDAIAVPTPSDVVARAVGTHSRNSSWRSSSSIASPWRSRGGPGRRDRSASSASVRARWLTALPKRLERSGTPRSSLASIPTSSSARTYSPRLTMSGDSRSEPR